MSEPFLGEIRMFAGNFAPRGWAFCNGQLLSISSNAALFSLLGTTYGGNGISTFGLPNLQGRFPMHWGNGSGLTPRVQGETNGVETVTLTSAQMPAHTHALVASSQTPTTADPAGAMLPVGSSRVYGTASTGSAMAAQSITVAGASLPHDNMPPFQTVSFIIALEGIYPSRT